MKKIVAIMLVLSFCFTLFSCDNNVDEPETTEEYVLPTPVIASDISLPYTSASDFDPFSTESSLNRDLIPILFESLFYATPDGKGENLISSGSTIKNKTVTVKLKQKIKFSDGTELLARHIKDSFEKAKKSQFYSDQLFNITSISVIDNYTVAFTLSSVDPLVNNSLNFPIVKDANGVYLGTGKYYIEYFSEAPYLQANKHHRDYSGETNKQIALYDMAGISGPVYPFKANEISVYKNDLSNGKYFNLSSKTISVETDSLVYIGVNSLWAGSITSISSIRQAVNIGIDRSVISASSYLGQGSPVTTPYKNDFYELNGLDLPLIKGDVEKAITLLENDGFNQVNSDGVRGNGGINLNVNILVCTENPYKITIAENFKASLQKLGFNVTITKKETQEEFLLALSEGHYSFYVGEVLLTPNCDLRMFFNESGSLNYGISSDIKNAYHLFRKGEKTTAEFINEFLTSVPFIPLFYRKNIVSVNPNMTGLGEGYKFYSTVSDWKFDKNG